MTRTVAWIALAALGAAAGTAGAWAHEGHDGHEGPTGRTFTIGKKSDVNIREDVKVGNEILKRGKYLFDHRVVGEDHVVVLTGIVKKDALPVVYQIPTRTIAARETAKRSVFVARELADHSLLVGVIQVAGEAVEHVPDGLVAVVATR